MSVAVLAGLPRNATFEWPDSSKYWRVLTNVNEAIEYHLKKNPYYFAQDKLVTDFQVGNVPPGDPQAGKKHYESIRKLLVSRGIAVGTYISGSTVLPQSEEDHYPPRAVAIEQMPPTAHYAGSWPGRPSRKYVDLTDADTRHAFQAAIRQIWEATPAPVRFVDNIPPTPKLGGGPWDVTCTHMHELGEIAASQGSRAIFNMAVHVGELTDREAQQLMDAVGHNGISLEMPWHANIRRSKEATKNAEKRYRQLLDSGMAIEMIPVKTPEDELKAWVTTWRKPTDHLYIAGLFYKPPDPSIHMFQ